MVSTPMVWWEERALVEWIDEAVTVYCQNYRKDSFLVHIYLIFFGHVKKANYVPISVCYLLRTYDDQQV
jgi:hypothetical protein